MRDKTNKNEHLKKFQITDKREVQIISKEQYEKMLEKGEVFEENLPTKKEIE